MGVKGRHSCSTTTKLRVINNTRFHFNDVGLSGKQWSGNRAGTGAEYARFVVVAQNSNNSNHKTEVFKENHACA